jgi:hypothetical protein
MIDWRQELFGQPPAQMPVDTPIQREAKADRLGAVYRPLVWLAWFFAKVRLMTEDEAATFIDGLSQEIEKLRYGPDIPPR